MALGAAELDEHSESVRNRVAQRPDVLGVKPREGQRMRIYLTHCTAKKDNSLKHTGVKVPPDGLYLGKFIEAFMRTCKLRGVQWAILSDLYGVWFPDTVHGWYDKHPNSVTDRQFWALVRDLDEKLEKYNEIWFYRNPADSMRSTGVF